jgi:hypothetical protein
LFLGARRVVGRLRRLHQRHGELWRLWGFVEMIDVEDVKLSVEERHGENWCGIRQLVEGKENQEGRHRIVVVREVLI